MSIEFIVSYRIVMPFLSHVVTIVVVVVGGVVVVKMVTFVFTFQNDNELGFNKFLIVEMSAAAFWL